MNEKVVIIAMVNGMIGGLILVLPILAKDGGTILSLLVIITTGIFSYYSCYLCISHLGTNSDLDKAILEHFHNSKIVRGLYDFLVFVNLLFILMLYFNLIVTQWAGLLPYNVANPICNAAGLIALTFALNYFHFGAKLLGYGVISIIGYCIFLVWLISSAPSGNNTIPLFGTGAVNLAASMGQAWSIQNFFIPVLREIPDSSGYTRYTLIAYLIGGSVYLFIAFAGSFGISMLTPGIVNRQLQQPVEPSEATIEDYFQTGQWEVAIV